MLLRIDMDGADPVWRQIADQIRSLLVSGRLRPGALIVADNADYCPEYLERVRAPGGGYMSTPFAEDVELSMRIG